MKTQSNFKFKSHLTVLRLKFLVLFIFRDMKRQGLKLFLFTFFAGSNCFAAIPLPWRSQDVGAVGGAGTASFSNGVFTVIGSGNGLGGPGDQVQFVYQPLVGNAEITARVTASPGTSAKALAFVSIRDSLMTGAAGVSLGFNSGNVTFQSRVADRLFASSPGGSSGLSLPCWLRLIRTLNTVSGYTSPDGTNWTTQGAVSLALGQIVYVGLGVTSGTNTLLNTSTFDNVSLAGTGANLLPPVTITLNGLNPLASQLGAPLVDPGAVVSGAPMAVAGNNGNNLVLKADGTVAGWGNPDPTNIPANATNLIEIVAGQYHFLALQAGGTPIGWDYDYWGQSSPPANLSNNVAGLAAGYGHSLALLTNGTVFAWGYNGYNQTNVPVNATNLIAIAAGGQHSLALRSDGTVIGWGTDAYNQNEPPASATNVVAIAETGDCSSALREDGTVVCWGYAGVGETTPPTSATNLVAIFSAGAGSVFLATRADGTAIAWGYTGDGQTQVPGNGTNLLAMTVGATQCLGVQRSDGAVISWGNPAYGPTNVIAGLDTLNETVVAVGTVNTNVAGTYLLAYSAQDLLGAFGSASRTVAILNPIYVTGVMLPSGGGFQLGFSSDPGLSFGVQGSTNLALPASGWNVIGTAQEFSPGQYKFTDPQTITQTQKYYRVTLN